LEKNNVYENITERTQGNIYIGVVGPVRTGKSTLIKRIIDLLVIPNIGNKYFIFIIINSSKHCRND